MFVHGLGLAPVTVGLDTLASFTTLYYASRHWNTPALALLLFGACFIATRLLFAGTINRWGGLQVAIILRGVRWIACFVVHEFSRYVAYRSLAEWMWVCISIPALGV